DAQRGQQHHQTTLGVAVEQQEQQTSTQRPEKPPDRKGLMRGDVISAQHERADGEDKATDGGDVELKVSRDFHGRTGVQVISCGDTVDSALESAVVVDRREHLKTAAA